ncbi:MAG: hypothetical protein QXU74_02045 [Candidatus Aenigmatarchaeota archaeon]
MVKRLSPSQIQEIESMLKSEIPVAEISKKLNLPYTTVQNYKPGVRERGRQYNQREDVRERMRQYQKLRANILSLVLCSLYDLGEATAQELSATIQQIIRIKVRPSTIEKVFEKSALSENWYEIIGNNPKKYRIIKDHWFVETFLSLL